MPLSTFVRLPSAIVVNPSPQTFLAIGLLRDATRTLWGALMSILLLITLPAHSDNVGARTLSAASFVSGDNMTAAACINFCDSKNYIYAGTEFSVRAPYCSLSETLF